MKLFHTYVRELEYVRDPGDVINLDSDADFELERLSMFFSPTGNPQTEETRALPQININIFDQALGRNVLSNTSSTSALFGDGRSQFVLPTSHFFTKGSQAIITYDAVDPGVNFGDTRCWLCLVGTKHFEGAAL